METVRPDEVVAVLWGVVLFSLLLVARMLAP